MDIAYSDTRAAAPVGTGAARPGSSGAIVSPLEPVFDRPALLQQTGLLLDLGALGFGLGEGILGRLVAGDDLRQAETQNVG